MRLITNNIKSKHVDVINGLIPSSNKIILCSGWLDGRGIGKILSNLRAAANGNTDVTIFSNKEHTKSTALEKISKHKAIKHVIVPKSRKYLHSKIYYFEKENTYTAIIGSANLTSGGLERNEELSVEIRGKIGDANHTNIVEYLDELEKLR